jgi:8-oxo-dGTP diphosphatase
MKTVIVAAAVIEERGRILVSRRPAGAHLEGYWEFPGGKLDEGESPEEALVRELSEELGISIRVDRILDVAFHRYPEKAVLVLFYACTRMSGEPRDLGVAAHRWAAVSDLRDEEFPPADVRLLARLRVKLPVT